MTDNSVGRGLSSSIVVSVVSLTVTLSISYTLIHFSVTHTSAVPISYYWQFHHFPMPLNDGDNGNA